MKLKNTLIAFSFLLINCVSAQTGFVNNGMTINVESGAYINVVDFTNNQSDSVNGSINLDGNLIVNGDFTNNSTGNVFSNIESTPDGDLVLAGTNQLIAGTTPVFFENIDVKNSLKTLDLNNCEVKGILTIDGIIDLNKNKLLLDNPDPGAISYTSGCIKSESLPADGLGEIQWNIGSNTGTYAVPFGTGIGNNDHNLILKMNTTPSPATGSVIFATFPTDASNQPYPSGITSLDTFQPKDLSDRYWKIEPVYTTKPDISINFKYSTADVDQTDNPKLVEDNLKAIRYNDVSNEWTDMKMTGICNVLNQTVNVDNITSDNFYTYWTLSEFELRIPNAFTPDNDGKNDVFMKGYSLKIFNRWGEQLYDGPDGWDGTVDGKKVSPGTYYYAVAIPDADKSLKTVTGIITVVVPE
jgi:gliding motility-associated-like protein